MADGRLDAGAMSKLLRPRDLQPGDRVRVVGYADESAYSRRLLNLGLVAGTELQVRRRAPLGDPLEIRFRGYSLALRPSEADCLLLEEA